MLTDDLRRNLALASLPDRSIRLLHSLMTAEFFDVGGRIAMPEPDPAVRFITKGFVSIFVQVGTHAMEIGLVGREGMIGLPFLLGAAGRYRIVFRHPTQAVRISVPDFHEALVSDPAIGDVVLRFMQAGTAQVIYNSFANAHLSVVERIARWLLMADDRSEGETIEITHAGLAECLDIQRSGVTLALRDFDRRRVVRLGRGVLTVLDRATLLAIVGAGYGPAEAAYAAVFPTTIDHQVVRLNGIEALHGRLMTLALPRDAPP